MFISELLEKQAQRLGINLKETLGEEALAKLNEVEVNETISTKLLNGLITNEEAETSSSLFEKHKERWHKEARKAAYDSIDSTHSEAMELLNSTDLEEYKVIETTKEKNKYLLQKLKTKIANANTDAEKVALKQDYDDYKKKVASDFIPKDSVKSYIDEVEALKRKLSIRDKQQVKNELFATAAKSGKLIDSIKNSPLATSVVNEAVIQYLKETTFMAENVKAELVLDEDTGQVNVRQKGKEIGISVDGNVLKLEDIVVSAIKQFGLHKEVEEPAFRKVVFDKNEDTKVTKAKAEFLASMLTK